MSESVWRYAQRDVHMRNDEKEHQIFHSCYTSKPRVSCCFFARWSLHFFFLSHFIFHLISTFTRNVVSVCSWVDWLLRCVEQNNIFLKMSLETSFSNVFLHARHLQLRLRLNVSHNFWQTNFWEWILFHFDSRLQIQLYAIPTWFSLQILSHTHKNNSNSK